MDMATNPRWLNNSYDKGGVGLGIVVALDKSTNNGSGDNILAKYALCGPFSIPSNPVPVSPSSENKGGVINVDDGDVVEMMEGLEEFTYVTCYGPDNSVTTRVYHEGGELYGKTVGYGGRDISGKSCGVFNQGGPDSDFLSSCHLCRKSLHGKDIYMYRGEDAFCSTECREKQIVIDERKEQCKSGASRSSDVVSTSPYTSDGQISLGIIAV